MDYVLDGLTLEQVMMFWNYGHEAQLEESMTLIGVLGRSMSGKPMPKIPKIVSSENEAPDRKAFHRQFGSKIKRG